MMMNSRSTDERIRRLPSYPARLSPLTAAVMASQDSIMSAKWARASRGIQHPFRAMDVACDVWVLDGPHHDQVDLQPQQCPEFFEQAEVGVDPGVWFHRSEIGRTH